MRACVASTTYCFYKREKGMPKAILIVIAFILLSASLSLSYTGEAGPPMLKMIYGSRALSLGGAFVGVSDDVYYIDSNPAGGDVKKITQISLLHQEWIEDVNYEALRISSGFFNKFYLGLGLTYLYIPFTYYDEYGYDSGAAAFISQAMATLNFGIKMTKYNLGIGTNFKVLYNNVPSSLLEARYGNSYEDQNYLVFATDIGIISRTNLMKRYIGPEPSLTFGFVLKNLGYSEAIEKLPTELHAGVSYRPFRHLLLAAEAVYPFYEPIYGSFGVEFDILQKVFLQGGIQIKENPMFAVGIGYKRKDMEVNVSYTPSLVFPNMISVSLNFFLGETETNLREKKIEAYFVVALEYFSERRFQDALELVDKVLELDPKHKRARSLKETIIKKIKLEESVEKYNNSSN